MYQIYNVTIPYSFSKKDLQGLFAIIKIPFDRDRTSGSGSHGHIARSKQWLIAALGFQLVVLSDGPAPAIAGRAKSNFGGLSVWTTFFGLGNLTWVKIFESILNNINEPHWLNNWISICFMNATDLWETRPSVQRSGETSRRMCWMISSWKSWRWFAGTPPRPFFWNRMKALRQSKWLLG